MTSPRKVSRQQLRKEPHIVWNEFIRLLGKSDYRDLSKIQRAAQLVYNYESEVQNGGHSLYFQTLPTERVREAIAALRLLGANCQADVLARAGSRFDSTPRVSAESDDDYVERAMDEEFVLLLGRDFYECQPDLQQVLETFLAQNQPQFVVVAD